MRILGIDPGVATTGWAIVDFINGKPNLIDFGVISTQKERSQSERLVEISEDLDQILQKFRPEKAGVELLLFNNNVKTAMSVGEARGVVLLGLQKANIPVLQFTPPQVKSSVTGNGRADKKQVQASIKMLLGLDEIPKPDDAADAIAISLCCFDNHKMDKMAKGVN
ncbi:crossover junction endodeoxyribonuclease RuvC [bacterium]|nr:crossover junction endodeoxyribonuclease RuvC [bacterium]